MALQVWLPLNGNLNNQGINNVTITNNGAAINNSGKIGKCYSFGTSASYMTIPKEAMTSLTTEASVCFWIKVISWNTSYATFLQAGLSSTPWTHYTFGFLRNNTVSTCCFTISNGSTSSQAQFLTPALELNTWYHISLLYKTGHCLIYINGELYRDYTTSIVPNFAGITHITLGACNTKTNYQTNCLLNDFRIYSHCLSPKEVKDISKGLVLHYPLNDLNQTFINSFVYPTFDTSSSNGGWSHWSPSGSTHSFSLNTNKEYIYNKNNTYSHKFANTSGSYSICYLSPAFEGGYRSVQAIVKLENGEVPDLTKLYFSCNATTLSTPTTLTSLGDGFYLMKREGFGQDGSNDLVSIVSKGVTVYISEAYLEDDKEFCSNILNSDNDIVYDCSGYNNNGKLYSYDSEGSISVISDSPRYDRSIFLNSSAVNNAASGTVYIYGYCGLTTPNLMSVAFWCKPTANGYGNTTGQGLFCTTNYAYNNVNAGTDYYLSAMNHRDSTVDINDSEDQSASTLCRLSFTPTVGEWHHYAITYDGLTGRIYKDGVETQNKSFDSPKSLASFIGVIIGFSRAGGVWRRNKSCFSDFRVYATCLSQPDILELYNTSALIDNKGNGYSYEFDEISKNLFTLENWNEGCKVTLSYVNRNGSPSIPLNPVQFYYGSGDNRNLQFQTKFAPNTLYKFDLWIDTDDVYYTAQNKNVPGGLVVYYTDGTNSGLYSVLTSLLSLGNRDNPVGWVHKVYYSTPGKSISGVSVYYFLGLNVYYRWDSMIIPIESITEVRNNGIISTGSFRENVDIALICKGDNFDTNQLIEI